MPSEEVDYIPAQEIPRGGKLSRVIPEAPFTQNDDVFAESNQLTGAGDDHSVLINLGTFSALWHHFCDSLSMSHKIGARELVQNAY